MGEDKNREALAAEYEWLRYFGRELDMQAGLVTARLVEIERRLSDENSFTGDHYEVDERR